jgi:hypothetical protein
VVIYRFIITFFINGHILSHFLLLLKTFKQKKIMANICNFLKINLGAIYCTK